MGIFIKQELFNIADKVILVTGSSRGLGFAIAKGLAQAKAKLILNGLNPQRLQDSVKLLKSQDLDVCGYAFDITDHKQVKENIDKIQNAIGPIDVLFNNAGIQIRCNLENVEEQDWDRIFDINLKGAFLVAKEVVKSMLASKEGKIINICSLMSEVARPQTAPYAASKGGLKMLTKAMATEWGKCNIQVNGLGPGYFISEMTQPLVDDQEFNKWICNRTPAGRWGDIEELVGPAIFLSSQASNFVNGHILYVDGGILSSL